MFSYGSTICNPRQANTSKGSQCVNAKMSRQVISIIKLDHKGIHQRINFFLPIANEHLVAFRITKGKFMSLYLMETCDQRRNINANQNQKNSGVAVVNPNTLPLTIMPLGVRSTYTWSNSHRFTAAGG